MVSPPRSKSRMSLRAKKSASRNIGFIPGARGEYARVQAGTPVRLTRGTGNSPDSKDILAVSISAHAGFLADQLIERLSAHDYRVVRTRTLEEFLRHRRRLEIPSAFTESVLAGKPMKIRFSRTGEDLGADYGRVRLSRAAYTV